ncbi:MAG TPA: c-type cytochrome [Rhodanobacteraceae bacterium]
MNVMRIPVGVLLVGAAAALAACSGSATPGIDAAAAASAPVAKPVVIRPAATAGTKTFAPPPASSIPDTPFGAMVRKGRAIFVDTQANAKPYVGNGLSCVNCHLDAGRLANSAPLWGAWVRYPAYRSKNHKVNTFANRLQGCFRFSMNGTAPPVDSEVIVALEAYAYWLAKGAPTGATLPGAGYPKLSPPAMAPSYARGKAVFETNCALCHAGNGQGQKDAQGDYVFPPLWGPDSFNWGAGMAKVNTAAEFIHANMPFSRGGTLTAQAAWDVAWYMDSHERPQDPRFTGDVAATRKEFHATKWSRYGATVDGKQLGSLPLHRR